MSDWPTMKIADVCATFSGGTPSTAHPEYYDGDIPWIASSELNQGRITGVERSITQRGLESSSAKLVEAGTPLLALYGATAGVAAITEIAGAINQAVLALVPSRVDAEFLYQWLLTNRAALIRRYTQGGQPNLSGDIVRRVELPVPPLAEQKLIAAALSDADALVETIERATIKKQALRRGMEQELLTGRTRLPGFTEERQPIALEATGFTYGGLSGKSKTDFDSGGALFVTFLEVINCVRLRGDALAPVTVAADEHQNQVARGDVLFNTSSETPEEVALAAVVDFDPPARTYLNSFCFGYRLTRQDIIEPAYLAYLFRSSTGRRLVSALAQGATRYNISKRKVLKLAPEFPPIAEQRAVAVVLADADREIDALRRRASKAVAIKEGMAQQLLSGRRRLSAVGVDA